MEEDDDDKAASKKYAEKQAAAAAKKANIVVTPIKTSKNEVIELEQEAWTRLEKLEDVDIDAWSATCKVWNSSFLGRLVYLDRAKFYETMRRKFASEHKEEYANMVRNVEHTVNSASGCKMPLWCKIHLLWATCATVLVSIQYFVPKKLVQYEKLLDLIMKYDDDKRLVEFKEKICPHGHGDIDFFASSYDAEKEYIEKTYIWGSEAHEVIIQTFCIPILIRMVDESRVRLESDFDKIGKIIDEIVENKQEKKQESNIKNFVTLATPLRAGESHKQDTYEVIGQANPRNQRYQLKVHRDVRIDTAAKSKKTYFQALSGIFERLVKSVNKLEPEYTFSDTPSEYDITKSLTLADRRDIILVLDGVDMCMDVYRINDNKNIGNIEQIQCQYGIEQITSYTDARVQHYVSIGHRLLAYECDEHDREVLSFEKLRSNVQAQCACFRRVTGCKDIACIVDDLSTNWELITTGKNTNSNKLKEISCSETVAGLSAWFEPSNNKCVYWTNGRTTNIAGMRDTSSLSRKEIKDGVPAKIIKMASDYPPKNRALQYKNVLDLCVVSESKDSITYTKEELDQLEEALNEAIKNARPITVISSEYSTMWNKRIFV